MDEYAWTNHLLYLEQTDPRLAVSPSTVLVEIDPDLRLPAPLTPAFARMLRDAVLGRAVRAMQQYLNEHQQPNAYRFSVEAPVAWSTTEAESMLLGAEQPAVLRAALDVQLGYAEELAASADLADTWTVLTLPDDGDLVVGLPDATQVRVAQCPERFALVALLLVDRAPLDPPAGSADAETVVTLAMQHSACDAPLPLDVLAAHIHAADAKTWVRGMVCDSVHDGYCSYDVAQDTLTINAAQRAFLESQLEQAGWPAYHPTRAERDAQAQAQFGLLVVDAVHTARADDDAATLTLLTPHLWQCLRTSWVNQSAVTPQIVCAYVHLPATTVVQVVPWLRRIIEDDTTTAAATPALVALLLASAAALVAKINRLHTLDERRAWQTAVQLIAQWMQPHGPLAQARIAHTQAQLLDLEHGERARALDTAAHLLDSGTDSLTVQDCYRPCNWNAHGLRWRRVTRRRQPRTSIRSLPMCGGPARTVPFRSRSTSFSAAGNSRKPRSWCWHASRGRCCPTCRWSNWSAHGIWCKTTLHMMRYQTIMRRSWRGTRRRSWPRSNAMRRTIRCCFGPRAWRLQPWPRTRPACCMGKTIR